MGNNKTRTRYAHLSHVGWSQMAWLLVSLRFAVHISPIKWPLSQKLGAGGAPNWSGCVRSKSQKIETDHCVAEWVGL